MGKRKLEFNCSVFTDKELKQIQEEVKKELESRECDKKTEAWYAIVEAIKNYGEEIEVYSSVGQFLGTMEVGALGKIVVIDF